MEPGGIVPNRRLGLSAVGDDGADSAWLIAQHADAVNDLRRAWVEPLREAVNEGEADPRHLASLVDRIAVIDGVPQTFGTVVVLEGGEFMFPHPVREPSRLDARRAGIGLVTIVGDAELLERGEIAPFGPHRQDHPLLSRPPKQAYRRGDAALRRCGRDLSAET